MRLLFVDDEPNVLAGLRRLLFRYDDQWDMRFCTSGQEALQVLEEEQVDVLVTDMRMPGIDGAHLLQAAHDRFPGVARVVLSGHTEVEAALRALPVAHQFLTKPCPAEQLRGALERAATLKSIIADPALRELIGGLTGLPAQPKVFFELNRVLCEPRSSAKDLAAVVGRDIGISTKALQLVNTAFFAGRAPITDIEQAVARLGTNVLKAIVLDTEVATAFRAGPEHVPFIEESAQESLQVARVGERLARRFSNSISAAKIAADSFITGLEHDVGFLVLASVRPDALSTVLEQAAKRPRLEVEREVLGTTHAEIGAYLLSLWGLPDVISEAVALHHTPDALEGRGLDTASVLAFAHALVDEANGRQGVPTVSDLLEITKADASVDALRRVRDEAIGGK